MQIAILSKNNKNNILKSLVSMFGDPFFTADLYGFTYDCESSFRPHVWGFFFHSRPASFYKRTLWVFVPMFGDSFFTIASYRLTVHSYGLFSSPCLGILFSRYIRV